LFDKQLEDITMSDLSVAITTDLTPAEQSVSYQVIRRNGQLTQFDANKI
jgi:ribonucleoside-diphosphate reductase alpha chain